MTEVKIPDSMTEEVTQQRNILIEFLALLDAKLLAQYFEDPQSIVAEDLVDLLRQAVLDRKILPVLAGAAYKNKGIQPLLDAICAYLPAPQDQGIITGTHPDTDDAMTRELTLEAPFSAFVFKTVYDEQNRRLSFFRIYSGSLRTGEVLLNANASKNERIGQLYQMHANRKSDLTEVFAGDIVATTSLKFSKTGDTLCTIDQPILLEKLHIPEPVIGMSIEVAKSSDLDKLSFALAKLAEEDPTFKVEIDEQSGQTIINGMGELHLEIIVEKLKDDFNVAVNTGSPQVAYKEQLSQSTTHQEQLKKQSGGPGLFAAITVELGPADETFRNSEAYLNKGRLQFIDEIKGGAIPRLLIASVEKGFRSMMESGPLAGYPLNDLKVRLLDGKTHEKDSKPLAFELCAMDAFRTVIPQLEPQLLEPIMRVTVNTPSEFAGVVIGGLNRKRGVIKDQEMEINRTQISADVPLAEMFSYVNHLRTITKGRGTFDMQLSHYAVVPNLIAERIVTKVTFN